MHFMFAAAGAVVAIVLEVHLYERQRSKHTYTHTQKHLLCRLIDMYRCMALSFTLLFCGNSVSV